MKVDGSDNYLDAIASLIREEIPARELPPSFSDDMLFRMYAVLLVAVGEKVTERDVHNAWVAWMIDLNPSHPSLVPYEELPGQVAREDQVYVYAIRRVASRLSETSQVISEER